MAKLKGPLFSLGASQKLGNALVYFPWKGLNVVREYVIPANPRTSGQTTQRGYLTNIVTRIHEAQAVAAHALGSTDVMAYALWASVVKAATTWFNQACKNAIDQQILTKGYTAYRGGVVTPGVDELTVTVYSTQIAAGHITAGTFYYGTSKTALIHTKAATITLGENKAHAVINGLVTGTKYFAQFRPSAGVDYVNTDSGIYYGVPL